VSLLVTITGLVTVALAAMGTKFGTPRSSDQLRVLLRIPEAADALGVSRTELYRMLNRGDLSYVTIGRTKRIPVQAIEEFVERNLTRSALGKKTRCPGD
jgi:excisionase family DNA binding protein